MGPRENSTVVVLLIGMLSNYLLNSPIYIPRLV